MGKLKLGRKEHIQWEYCSNKDSAVRAHINECDGIKILKTLCFWIHH